MCFMNQAGATCFHIFDFVLIDNNVALCWATWTLKSINLTSIELGEEF